MTPERLSEIKENYEWWCYADYKEARAAMAALLDELDAKDSEIAELKRKLQRMSDFGLGEK